MTNTQRSDQPSFRRTFIRVMTMQLITLVVLAILHIRYDR